MKNITLILTEDEAEIVGHAIMGKIREYKDNRDELSRNQLHRLLTAYEKLDTAPVA